MLSHIELQRLNKTLNKKTIRAIKEVPIKEREDWYFVGIILTFP